jgi:hypothetical protein
MATLEYFFLFLMLAISIWIIYMLFVSRRDMLQELFRIGLREENNGQFESAVISYKNALKEKERSKSNRDIRMAIAQKVKVLHAVIEYNRNFGSVQ